MLRTGIVQSVDAGRLFILFDRPEACQKCGQCDGSKHATLIALEGQAQVGDGVEVDLPEGRVAQAALLAYIMPLALLLIGLLLSGPIQEALRIDMDQNLFAALCGVTGLALSVIPLSLTGNLRRTKAHFSPRIVAIHPKTDLNNTTEEGV